MIPLRIKVHPIFSELLAAALVLMFVSCGKYNPEVDPSALAVVGDQIIDKDAFAQKYQDFRRRTGAQDTGQARRSMLNNFISEALLIEEARRRGYDEDGVGQHEHERIKIQALLNAYHRRFISNTVSVTEDELVRLFVNTNTKIRASHLYAPTREQADSLFQLLEQGVPFEDLARTTFQDPRLRESSGSLGYFTVDEMEPSFEEAAYALDIGEISQPVRTSDGYSIIRVDDRKGNPLVTETEFSKHRHKLQVYWKKRKTMKALQRHTDSLKQALEISFNEKSVAELFRILKDENIENFQETEISQKKIHELDNMVLVLSKLGPWNGKKFQEWASYTSEDQHAYIRNIDNLKQFIEGLVIRSHIIKTAKKHKLHKTLSYEKSVNEALDNSLFERIENDLYQEFDIPEDSLRQYYESDPSRFAESPKIRLREIVLDNADRVDFIQTRLEAGIPFSDLATEYSVRPASAARGGDLGYLTPDVLGKWSSRVMSMEIGDWAGPLQVDPYLVFLKCVDKILLSIRSFEEARGDVENAVRASWWYDIRQERIQEIRENVTVASFPEKLIQTQFN